MPFEVKILGPLLVVAIISATACFVGLKVEPWDGHRKMLLVSFVASIAAVILILLYLFGVIR